MTRTPRPDWTLPDPPTEGAYPCAYNVGGEWWLYWGPFDHEGSDEAPPDVPWPFQDDEACSADDLRGLGFRIVEG